MTLTIIAHIEAKKDKIDLVKSELIKLIQPTRNEEGCLQYDLYQDNEKPELFLFYENWESNDFLQKHMKSQHIKAYMKATKGCLESFTINQMSLVK